MRYCMDLQTSRAQGGSFIHTFLLQSVSYFCLSCVLSFLLKSLFFFLSSGRLRLDQTAFYTKTLETIPTLPEPRASEVTCTTRSQKMDTTQILKTNKDKEEKKMSRGRRVKQNFRRGELHTLRSKTSLPKQNSSTINTS